MYWWKCLNKGLESDEYIRTLEQCKKQAKEVAESQRDVVLIGKGKNRSRCLTSIAYKDIEKQLAKFCNEEFIREIQERAENHHEATLSVKECQEVFLSVHYNHDCSNGLTWEYIDAEIDNYLRKQRERL